MKLSLQFVSNFDRANIDYVQDCFCFYTLQGCCLNCILVSRPADMRSIIRSELRSNWNMNQHLPLHYLFLHYLFRWSTRLFVASQLPYCYRMCQKPSPTPSTSSTSGSVLLVVQCIVVVIGLLSFVFSGHVAAKNFFFYWIDDPLLWKDHLSRNTSLSSQCDLQTRHQQTLPFVMLCKIFLHSCFGASCSLSPDFRSKINELDFSEISDLANPKK